MRALVLGTALAAAMVMSGTGPSGRAQAAGLTSAGHVLALDTSLVQEVKGKGRGLGRGHDRGLHRGWYRGRGNPHRFR